MRRLPALHEWRSIAFFPDNEPYELLKLHVADRDGTNVHDARAFAKGERAKLVEFLDSCDVLILDSQYTDAEYQKHIGWGHGSLSRAVSLAVEARVKKLLLFHHDPNHADEKIDDMLEAARLLALESGQPLEGEAAQEGAELWLTGRPSAKATSVVAPAR